MLVLKNLAQDENISFGIYDTDLVINDSSFGNNTALNGGAIYSEKYDSKIISCTFFGN